MVVSQALSGAALLPVPKQAARFGAALPPSLPRPSGQPLSQGTCPTTLRSCGRVLRTVARVSDHEYHAIPFNLEQDYVEAKVEAGEVASGQCPHCRLRKRTLAVPWPRKLAAA